MTAAISSALSTTSNVFFPTKLPEVAADITFKSAVNAETNQRLARITKAALFALSSVAATITLVLTEAAVITWPFAIPFILLTIISGIAFFRLNHLDNKYTAGLDDKTRESLVKKELEQLLTVTPIPEKEKTLQTLKDINRLLKCEIFDKEKIEEISNLYTNETIEDSKSLIEIAKAQGIPIKISANTEWFEQGHYGLACYQFKVEVNGSGSPESPIEVLYSQVEKNKDGSDLKKPTQEVNSKAAPSLNELSVAT